MIESSLSPGGRRAFAFILKGIREGLSGAEILRQLRAHGLGYRTSDFYNDLRIIQGAEKAWDTMKHVPKDKIITERLYMYNPEIRANNFITRFQVEYIDPVTGEKMTDYVSVAHESPMRRIDLEEEAKEAIQCKYGDYEVCVPLQITRIIPVGGFRRV